MSLFETVIQMQGTLFVLIAVGFLLCRFGPLHEKERGFLSDLLINVFLPCTIILSFDIELNNQLAMELLLVFGLSFCLQTIYYLLTLVLYRKDPEPYQKSMKYATICSNAGFLGLPIAYGIFGAEGVLYASVALIPLRLFNWSVGLSLFTNTSRKTIVKNLLIHPCIVSVAIGVVLMIVPFKLPAFLNNAISYMGGCTTAVSMILIGGILGDAKTLPLKNKSMWKFCAIRLIGIPVLVFLLMKLCPFIPALPAGVMILMAAMPAGSTTAILAEKYGQDSQFASHIVFMSTLLSIVTIPLISFLF